MSEEKKISLEDLEELLEDAKDNTSKNGWFSLPNLFALLVLNWQWFLLSLIIFLSASLLYLRYASPVYKVSGRMLVKDEMKARNTTQMLANMQDLGFLSNSTGIENEVEVLQSRVLLRDVVKDLKLYTEYRSEGRIVKPIQYKTQPVNVDLDPQHLDSLDINLLEKTQWLNMRITRQDSLYILEGSVMVGNKAVEPFNRRAKNLPAVFTTSMGTVTLTANGDRKLEDGKVLLATLMPPMAVATHYLAHLTTQSTSTFTPTA